MEANNFTTQENKSIAESTIDLISYSIAFAMQHK